MSQAFIYLGTIEIPGPIVDNGVQQLQKHEIWCSNGDPALGWEAMRLKYYPNYDGPPPTLLEAVIARFERRGAPKELRDPRAELTL
jgi:hypothetical protein